MAKYIQLPKLGLTMKTGIITGVLIKKGQSVKSGEEVMEFETDKISGTIESPVDGVVLDILVSEGEEVEVLSEVCLIGDAGESAEEFSRNKAEQPEVPVVDPVEKDSVTSEISRPDTDSWVRAMPLARKTAAESGIDLAGIRAQNSDGIIRHADVLASVKSGNGNRRITPAARRIAEANDIEVDSVDGSGVSGRIFKADIESEIKRKSASSGIRRRKLSSMRRVIAARMEESKRSIPHVYFSARADAYNIVNLKNELNRNSENQVKITVNDLILKVFSVSLRNYPEMYSFIDGDEIITPERAEIGFAVSVDGGLVVPVVRGISEMGVRDIAARTGELVKKAKNGSLSMEEMAGGNFTVSNLGGYGVDLFYPIISPGQSAIAGIGSIREEAVPYDGEICIRPVLDISLSVDHRLIDGAVAAAFLKKTKETLENIQYALI